LKHGKERKAMQNKEKIKEFVSTFNEEKRLKWNKVKEWWEPVVYFDDSEYYNGKNVDWLCDNLGDAQDIMEAMWCQILKLKGQL